MGRPSEVGKYGNPYFTNHIPDGGGSVMVWGCMSAVGTGELQFIEGTMNANM